MHHFKYFPKFEYDGRTAVNILARAKIREMILNNTVLFYTYTLSDGDRPDIVAHKYYGSSNHTWLVLYANNIKDPIFDWMLDHEQFLDFICGKHGSIDFAHQKIHHYENANGFVVDETTYNSVDFAGTSVSVFQHEQNLNEAKRDVKLIDSSYKSTVIEELKRLFK